MATEIKVTRSGVTTWLLWECLEPEVQAELRALMPLDWEPPSSNHRRLKFDCQLESLEEIDRLMRRRPRYPKEVSFAH